jgi:hypothetical protein
MSSTMTLKDLAQPYEHRHGVHARQKVYILNEIPGGCEDELHAISAIELKGDVSKIK